MDKEKSDYYLLNLEGAELQEELAKLDSDNVMRLAVRMADRSPVDAHKIQVNLPPKAQKQFKNVVNTINRHQNKRRGSETSRQRLARLYYENRDSFPLKRALMLAVIAYVLLSLALGQMV
ncbi:hypothetical protein [Thiomicrospira sp. WB1]|uniref:hypothetical protein n=1 Tax=Thiomicrospira sp. WB1 TaxID=1685380 RepID=UPI000749E9B9|nr:hypothetical protein [Thiomicrospira sp. WB1]KUJ71853.1 hypothetical protein AVO41_05180 [Thiomicrospira sp. WB1]